MIIISGVAVGSLIGLSGIAERLFRYEIVHMYGDDNEGMMVLTVDRFSRKIIRCLCIVGNTTRTVNAKWFNRISVPMPWRSYRGKLRFDGSSAFYLRMTDGDASSTRVFVVVGRADKLLYRYDGSLEDWRAPSRINGSEFINPGRENAYVDILLERFRSGLPPGDESD